MNLEIDDIHGRLWWWCRRNRISYFKGRSCQLHALLAADLAPYNITVNAIGPGVFDSELTHDILDSEMVRNSLNAVPLKRHGNEGELDGALIYFASDASSYCTVKYFM